MKKFFLIVLIIISSLQLFSQIPPSRYIANNTMNAFHGTWTWDNGTDNVTIYLMTKPVYFNVEGGYTAECLIGWHIYKKAGVTIESSINNINIINSRTLRLNNESTPSGVVSGTFLDKSLNKMCDLTLTINGSHNELAWHLESTAGLKYRKPTDPPFQPGFTLPENIVLTKVP